MVMVFGRFSDWIWGVVFIHIYNIFCSVYSGTTHFFVANIGTQNFLMCY